MVTATSLLGKISKTFGSSRDEDDLKEWSTKKVKEDEWDANEVENEVITDKVQEALDEEWLWI